jgi:hypothetical protein
MAVLDCLLFIEVNGFQHELSPDFGEHCEGLLMVPPPKFLLLRCHGTQLLLQGGDLSFMLFFGNRILFKE